MNNIIGDNFIHVRRLSNDIESMLSIDGAREQRIGNELAGMFAVTISATYEGIIKQSIISYASKFHLKYRDYIKKDFENSNARIRIESLNQYAKKFGLNEHTVRVNNKDKNVTTFQKILLERVPVIERRFRKDPIVSYGNILRWRNTYAHERSTQVTLSDVYESHRVAQYVIKSFVKAFNEG